MLQRESHVASGVASLSVSARISEVLDYLKDQGLLEYITIYENQTIASTALKWCDVLILSKHNSSLAVTLVLQAKKIGVKVIYDIDDWVFSFPGYSAYNNCEDSSDRAKEIIRLADYVSVANEFLFSEVVKFRDDAILVANGMYVEKYVVDGGVRLKPDLLQPKIVFTNADLLKIESSKVVFLSMLQEFFYDHSEYILEFYGDPFPEMFTLSFLRFTNRLSYSDYLFSLINGNYQFSVTPLGGIEDHQNLFFNSCKNPFKYLNYGALGVPGIYSESPIYDGCIRSRETGLLAENTRVSWLESMDEMAVNRDLRETIRVNAYNDICENHHIKFGAMKLYELIVS